MEAAGVSPDAITKVALTHAHPDHIWGMLTSEGLRFPNATYYVAASEWAFWMDPDYRNHLPEAFHIFAEGAQRDLNAIRDRVVMVEPGDEILSGMRVIGTPGHTPGHVSFGLKGGDGLVITGDALTNEISSFRYPLEPFGFDAISETAIQSRIELLRRAAAERVKLLGFHWTYPGVGFAEVDGSAYRFVPI
jgi:glyoxylase-like metal-dependent hydrolase (beta-lactamase superfamily II)